VCSLALETEPLELLFERDGLPRFGLPSALSAIYGGDLGFSTPRLFANFVSSIDGVVALPGGDESGHVVSGDSEADRFVMALLRACADAVVVGAGTFRKGAGHLWHSDDIYPDGARGFEETRSRLGLARRPALVLVTGSGLIDTTQPAVRDAIVVTTPAGEARLRHQVPSTARIVVSDDDKVRFADVIQLLHKEGLRLLLTEGGPSLVAHLVAETVLDELFVTSSPTLFGRYPNDHRKSLIDGLDLADRRLELLSVRRHRSHLFLRYALSRP
jgi:riboflavin biosynthesis pyrimidine reductase